MEKKLVFVVVVDVDKDLEGSIVKAMEDFKWRIQGAYAAKVVVHEVKVERD